MCSIPIGPSCPSCPDRPPPQASLLPFNPAGDASTSCGRTFQTTHYVTLSTSKGLSVAGWQALGGHQTKTHLLHPSTVSITQERCHSKTGASGLGRGARWGKGHRHGSFGRLAGKSRVALLRNGSKVRWKAREEEEMSADWQGGTAYSGRAVHLSRQAKKGSLQGSMSPFTHTAYSEDPRDLEQPCWGPPSPGS